MTQNSTKMKNRKKTLELNDRNYRSTTLKIGIALIIFYELFSLLSTVAMIPGAVMDSIEGETTVFSYSLTEILLMIAYILGFVVPAIALWLFLRKKQPYQPIKKQWHVPAVAPLIILSAVALNFAASYMNSYLVTLLLPFQMGDMSTLIGGADELHEILLMFVSIAVIPAIVEEILFRGVILSNLMPYGRTAAILGSAVLFGLMHGNILQFFYTTMLGVVLGYVCVRTKSIWCGIIIHFVNNGISVVQEVCMSCLEADAAARVVGAIELVIMIGGAVSAVILLLIHFKQKKPEDHGSFGVTFEPDLDYEQLPVTRSLKLRRFFSPTMIVFAALSTVNMIVTLVVLMMAGAMT